MRHFPIRCWNSWSLAAISEGWQWSLWPSWTRGRRTHRQVGSDRSYRRRATHRRLRRPCWWTCPGPPGTGRNRDRNKPQIGAPKRREFWLPWSQTSSHGPSVTPSGTLLPPAETSWLGPGTRPPQRPWRTEPRWRPSGTRRSAARPRLRWWSRWRARTVPGRSCGDQGVWGSLAVWLRYRAQRGPSSHTRTPWLEPGWPCWGRTRAGRWTRIGRWRWAPWLPLRRTSGRRRSSRRVYRRSSPTTNSRRAAGSGQASAGGRPGGPTRPERGGAGWWECAAAWGGVDQDVIISSVPALLQPPK